MNAALDVAEYERLVRLRELLDEAEKHADQWTQAGRHTTLVLLDGACEYALGIAARACGDARATPKFEQLVERPLATSGRDTFLGWKGVLELHRQRNTVQHEGVLPDPDNVSRWFGEAQRFVADLVEAVFGIDFDQVRAAGAVANESLRAELINAESAIENENAVAALRAALRAWDIAFSRWKADSVTGGTDRFQRSHFDIPMPQGVDTQLRQLADFNDAAPFCDLSDYLWFRSLPHPDHPEGLPIDLPEASRAVRFVRAWILRWEAFLARYQSREERRARLPGPSLATDGEPLSIVGLTAAEFGTNAFDIEFTVEALPPVEPSIWLEAFAEKSREALLELAAADDTVGRPSFSCEATGRCFARRIPRSIAVPSIIEALHRGMDAATSAHHDELGRREARLRATSEAVGALHSMSMPLLPSGTSLVSSADVRLEDERPYVSLAFDDVAWTEAAFDAFWQHLANGAFAGRATRTTRERMLFDPAEIEIDAVPAMLSDSLGVAVLAKNEADRERNALQAELDVLTRQLQVAASVAP